MKVKIIISFFAMLINVTVELLYRTLMISDVAYLTANLILIFTVILLFNKKFLNGFLCLIRFKRNCNVSIAFAAIFCVIQTIYCLIFKNQFLENSIHIYSILVVTSFFFMSLGEYICDQRIKKCLEFFSIQGIKKSFCLIKDKNLLSSLSEYKENPKIAYTCVTNNFKSSKKMFYSADPSTGVVLNMSVISCFYCIGVGIVLFFIHKDFLCALSATTVSACMCIPMSLKLAANLPLKQINKSNEKFHSIISGFFTLKKFGDVKNVILSDFDLYSRRKISLQGIKTFNGSMLDDALMYSSVIIKKSDGLLRHVFSKIIKNKRQDNFVVTKVQFEDGLGTVGWVNGKRILVGNKNFIKKYELFPPSKEYEQKHVSNNRQVTYLAVNNQLVAMVILKYRPNVELKKYLKQLEKLGVKILITTSDNNVTQELIAKDFDLYYDSVKIVSDHNKQKINKEKNSKDHVLEPYAVAFGGTNSFIRAIVLCIKAKSAVALGLTVQIISLILGVALVLFLVFYTTIDRVGNFELFCYSFLWTVCACVAPKIFLYNGKER